MEESAKLETLGRLYNEYWMPGDLARVDEVLDPAIVWTAIESAPDAGTRRDYHVVQPVGPRRRSAFGIPLSPGRSVGVRIPVVGYGVLERCQALRNPPEEP